MKKILFAVTCTFLALPSFAYKTLYDLTTFEGGVCYISGDDIESNPGDCLSETVKSLNPGMWGVPMLDDKDQLDLVGNTVCVDYQGKQAPGEAADDQSYFTKPDYGPYCYCQMIGPETSAWMYMEGKSSFESCNGACASDCAKWIAEDSYNIRTNMFKTVNYGGVDYSWLYDTTGESKHCYVETKGNFGDVGCPSGTDKIITEPRQWAAVLDSKEHPNTLVTGTAWVSDNIDTKEPYVGYIPTAPEVIRGINEEYASYKSGENPYNDFCYCKMETPGESSWVLAPRGGLYLDVCIEDCADLTSNRGNGQDETNLTNAMFSTLKSAAGGMSMVVTTQKYVDDLLNTKQAKITTTGTNKLMTYGAYTGATPGSRNIVSTLGTSTAATTVPNTGAVLTGVNTKQGKLSGTNGWVATYTGTAGIMNSKPVYGASSSTHTDALITAYDVNGVARRSANAELTCALFVGGGNTDADCLLWELAPYGVSGQAFGNSGIQGGFGSTGDHCAKNADCFSYFCSAENLCVDDNMNTKSPIGATENIAASCATGTIISNICVVPGCTAAGGACNIDRDCCMGSCVAGKCATTRGTGFYCTAGIDCTSGDCTEHSCSSSTYKLNGSACRADSECQSGVCFADMCRDDCLSNETRCSSNADCCSGNCFNGSCTDLTAPDGLCNIGEHSECATGICVAGVCGKCLPPGAPSGCTSNADCCNGSCTKGRCSIDRLSNGKPCRNGSDCISGSCENNRCVPAQCQTVGSSCDKDSPCCEGGYCGNGFVCYAKKQTGEQCKSGSECLSRTCRNKYCL